MSLKKILYSFLFSLACYNNIYSFTLIIDPIGDAKHTGREIEDTFERVLTLQCAQKLKELINYNFPGVQVIITRAAGETLATHQNASFANRMNADLYLALSFYHQPSIPNNVAIFYYRENSMDQYHKYDPYHFYHITQAHLISSSISMNIAKIFAQTFQNKSSNHYFLPLGCFGIPCQALSGVKSAAIYIEAGLNHKNDWEYIIQPILTTIHTMVS